MFNLLMKRPFLQSILETLNYCCWFFVTWYLPCVAGGKQSQVRPILNYLNYCWCLIPYHIHLSLDLGLFTSDLVH